MNVVKYGTISSKSKKDIYDYIFLFALICIIAFQDNTVIFLSSQFLLIIITIIIAIKEYHKTHIPWLLIIWMVLFTFFGTASSMWAKDIGVVFSNAISTFQTFLLNISVAIYIHNRKKPDYFYLGFTIAAFVLLMRLIISTPLGEWGTERLGSSIGYNQNNVGMIFAFASLLIFYRFKFNKKRKILVLSFILIISSFLTGSRKAFFIAALGPIIATISLNNRKKLFRTFLFSASLLLILFYLVMNIEIFYQIIGVRLESIFDFIFGSGNVDKSTDTRMLLILSAWRAFLKKPFLGLGLDNFKLVNFYGTYAHNNYFELLASTGLIGLTIYYYIPLKYLFRALKNVINGKTEYSIVVTILICILIVDFWNVSYWMELIQILLGYSFGYFNLLKKSEVAIYNENNYTRGDRWF